MLHFKKVYFNNSWKLMCLKRQSLRHCIFSAVCQHTDAPQNGRHFADDSAFDCFFFSRFKYHGNLFPVHNKVALAEVWFGVEQAPVPLSIFRSNSKFDENSERYSFEYTRPITTKFCTRHDSDTVVTCAKYRCDRPRIFYTKVFWIFIEFRIRSKHV